MSSYYYKVFDSLTNDGYLFDVDRSSDEVPQRALTIEEKKERKAWKKLLGQLRNHYASDEAGDPPNVETTEDLMNVRFLPPRLEDTDNVTSRTGDKELRARLYPKPAQVEPWDDFQDRVRNYSPPDIPLRKPNQYGSLFLETLLDSSDNDSKSYNSERGEERYLLQFLDSTLVKSKIVTRIDREDEARGIHGKPDFTVWVKSPKKGNQLVLIGESKSTHNLLLPMNKEDVVLKYRMAYQAVIQDGQERTTEWNHIAHPFAQLLSYMVDNKKRYGALTCATRTYFVCLDGNKEDMKVKISDPYFTGESTYLRAWSCIISLGTAQQPKFVICTEWIRTNNNNNPTPDGTDTCAGNGRKRQPKIDRRNKQRKRRRSEQSGETVSPKCKHGALSLTHVPFQDLKLGAMIGHGRNGSVFQAQWQNQTIALKPFDLGKGGYEPYHKELAAYARLQDAWGRLTPEPLFVTESLSGNILYLGLELGRDPCASDYASKDWSSLLYSLEAFYGIRKHDSIYCNGLIITRDGQDHLVAIDFEDWSDCAT